MDKQKLIIEPQSSQLKTPLLSVIPALRKTSLFVLLTTGLVLLNACGGPSEQDDDLVGSSSSSSNSSNSSSSSSSSGTINGPLTVQEDDDALCLLEGVTESLHDGFTGSGYANSENAPDTGLVWHVNADQAGAVDITFRYANGSASSRPATLHINGARVYNLDFPSSDDWTVWRDAPISVNLDYGYNTISLLSKQVEGLANIDAMELRGLGLTEGNCASARINGASSLSITTKSQFEAETFTRGADYIAAFDWSFGDSSFASGQSVSHQYTTPGMHTVQLTITDKQGEQSVVQKSFNVLEGAGLSRVFIAGDSTVSTYTDTSSPNDQAGWGQMLHEQFSEQVSVFNHAIGGRTARRFIDEGRLDAVWNEIQAGDYFLVQFGTNDGHKTATYTIDGQSIPYYLEPNTDFKTWLQKYVDGANSRGVKLVFVTPPPRNSAYCTGGNGTGGHAQAMREFAESAGIPLVDLNAKSVSYLKSICPAPTPEDFFLLRADGSVDGTHFQEHGARTLSSMVADGLAEANLPISQHRK